MKQYNSIPIQLKKTCCELYRNNMLIKEIYDNVFKKEFEVPQTYEAFCRSIKKWLVKIAPDDLTLDAGTYEGFTAHDATVQVSKDGEIIQAWVKQKADEFDPNDFIEAIKESVEPYNYNKITHETSSRMLEIPLFDMHWGISYMDYYEPILKKILTIIESNKWQRIEIPFGQDFFHNDSVVRGETTKGTLIEKVDTVRAVKEGQQFIYALVDAALRNSNEVRVVYSPGNHDKSISWMFMQVLLERYGKDVVDDTLANRKVIKFGKNSIMITHGNSKKATAKNLAQIFPISFPEEFTATTTREVHAGHLHTESSCDIYGVMIRRLSSATKTDEWSDDNDFIGSHKRFMLFDWAEEKLNSIYYI